ncbi:MAG TPA: DUF1800 domain-containing protein [Burkholderiales bacterium]|nr:DUF1800 domain-containing protein [Burkholderiales bacterium]
MTPSRIRILKFWPALLLAIALPTSAASPAAGPSAWTGDLGPIAESDWNRSRAAHLLERAGFGGTPEEIDKLAAMTADEAVRHLVFHKEIPNPLPDFDHSGVHDPGIEPFPPSRPAATNLARDTGEAIGVKVKPSGNRRMQPVVDRFFYWLRASMLESHRVAYWWGQRMLTTNRPLEEKMALFWHGHFATSEDKVRDYRKLLGQNELFREQGTGNFRDLLISVSQDPAMLAFLDAGVNVKGSPNENFAREIMELFTMGVGHYSENDIREAARAFTGWNFVDLTFVINENKHDETVKTVLGQSGSFDGVEVIDIILAQPVTADYIAGKIYRYFVREDLSAQLQTRLGDVLRDADYDLAPFLYTMFMSRDFYSPASVATRIKPPVELVVSTYKKMGLTELPGVPDFNIATETLGQRLLFPPTVAGWAQGKSWITPGLLLARGNFVYDTVFPDINFIPPDRHPTDNYQISTVADRLAEGADVSTATQPPGRDMTSMSNSMVDRDEAFNTRLGSYRGWRMAIEKVKPIPRTTAQVDLTSMIQSAGCATAQQAVDYLAGRFLSVPLDEGTRGALTAYLENEIGGSDLAPAETYLEEPLRATLHLILSLPDYQLG